MTLEKDVTEFANAINGWTRTHNAALLTARHDAEAKDKASEWFQEIIRKHNLPMGTHIRVGDSIYTYGPTITDVVTPDKWLELYEKKQINRQQFLGAISVSRGDAEKLAGADIVLRIKVKKKGSKSDLRKDKFEKETGTVMNIVKGKIQVFVPHTNIKKRTVPVKLAPTTLKRKINLVTRR